MLRTQASVQRSAEDQKLHRCAFFSRRFSPAEENYDIGNRELLAVVAAFEEWRHWLEGAEHTTLVWSDHKNLTFIRAVRRLGAVPGKVCVHPHVPTRVSQHEGGRPILPP